MRKYTDVHLQDFAGGDDENSLVGSTIASLAKELLDARAKLAEYERVLQDKREEQFAPLAERIRSECAQLAAMVASTEIRKIFSSIPNSYEIARSVASNILTEIYAMVTINGKL